MNDTNTHATRRNFDGFRIQGCRPGFIVLNKIKALALPRDLSISKDMRDQWWQIPGLQRTSLLDTKPTIIQVVLCSCMDGKGHKLVAKLYALDCFELSNILMHSNALLVGCTPQLPWPVIMSLLFPHISHDKCHDMDCRIYHAETHPNFNR